MRRLLSTISSRISALRSALTSRVVRPRDSVPDLYRDLVSLIEAGRPIAVARLYLVGKTVTFTPEAVADMIDSEDIESLRALDSADMTKDIVEYTSASTCRSG